VAISNLMRFLMGYDVWLWLDSVAVGLGLKTRLNVAVLYGSTTVVLGEYVCVPRHAI
jgi:hypothetical protein